MLLAVISSGILSTTLLTFNYYKMKTLNFTELNNKIKSGRFFSLTYTRANQTLGRGVFRKGVTKYLKGGKLKYNLDAVENINLFNTRKKAYRTIKFERIISAKIDGVEYTFFRDPWSDGGEMDQRINNINQLTNFINR